MLTPVAVLRDWSTRQWVAQLDKGVGGRSIFILYQTVMKRRRKFELALWLSRCLMCPRCTFPYISWILSPPEVDTSWAKHFFEKLFRTQTFASCLAWFWLSASLGFFSIFYFFQEPPDAGPPCTRQWILIAIFLKHTDGLLLNPRLPFGDVPGGFEWGI